MKLSVRLLGLAGCIVTVVGTEMHIANAQTNRDELIREALERGAHQVVCRSNRCQDQTTMEVVDHAGAAPNGIYLVYPDTPANAESIAKTRDQAKTLGK